ncbi:UDP-glucose dehydrogenase family protein [Papillibacter cinnamivorans]|uniref:UDP-glucose 6-dehydrogenase n=1 Tax=Papillibacter cinnamivorans DSM 12816 TaxID=1122930 RepID=A0A1W2CEK1_9FIRM|nr:nucleotide sugar dehydrogenase [Papillibacter cinnamivorans]SMC83643.1 UDPglucose 6-dehydrogenase [Papillibacter cinnamivorans DSM 12816]
MVITVIGLGYIGLTAALGFAELGCKVYGTDTSTARMSAVSSGRLPVSEPGLGSSLARHLGRGFLPCSNMNAMVAESDCIFFCVGTPGLPDSGADLSCLAGAVEQVLDILTPDHFKVLVIKSTIPPSTAVERIVPLAENRGLKAGKDIGIAVNPEFLREGSCWDDFMHPDRIVLGVSDRRSEALLRELYAPFGAPILSVDLTTAEFIKYLSNSMLAMMISFSNEMSLIADAIGGIDVASAFRILHLDRRWNECDMRSYLYPGCGYGGYCLPKDTRALYSTARAFGMDPQMLKNTIAVNDSMAAVTAGRIARAAGRDPGAAVGILGLSFKPGSGDTRDSPAAGIIRELNRLGYRNILCYDPEAAAEFQASYPLEYYCVGEYARAVSLSDVIALVTAWPEFKNIREMTDKPIVDCRYML